MADLPSQLPSLKHALVMLPVAALLGAALGVIRPIRRSLVSRSSHVIQAQVDSPDMTRRWATSVLW
jgi:hypothetical protein